MKISERWLREWVDTNCAIEEIAERLTMAGLEVDAMETAGPALDGVVIGRILDRRAHPEADRLHICDVDINGPAPLPIVCGAPNAEEGAVVPVATVGTILPGGVEIMAAPICGADSQGMLCSASELGLNSDADGLWHLDGDAPVGEALSVYLGLPDRVLDLDLTPNRGDCLSMRGVAREVAVAQGCPLCPPWIEDIPARLDTVREVHVDAPEQCAGYAARCVEGIDTNAVTPVWMSERLRRAGVRAINLPVDIGNYLMIELGQPMHAFDADKLVGDIHVRMAHEGERIVTLDGESVDLASTTLVIADAKGAVAIAGMIGGERTAVDDTTRNVVFESACFTPAAVAGQGRRYKIHTDSLHRFERGVDPQMHPQALKHAVALLERLGGAKSGPPIHAAGDPIWPADRRIALYAPNVEKLLGQTLEPAVMTGALEALGIAVEAAGSDEWRAIPPSWRFDLGIEADLIEEIARVYGYDRMLTRAQGIELPPVSAQALASSAEPWHDVLRQRGYHEAITYSFVEPGLHATLIGSDHAVTLDNPISDQYVEMRRTLWASLLPSWHYNVRRQQATVRLYESGLRFLPDPQAEQGIAQIPTLAGLISGNAEDTHWDRTPRPVDFFDLKGDVEALFAGSGARLTFEPDCHPALHPGRSARLYADGEPAGWLGQLSPSFFEIFKNSSLPYLFEVDSSFLMRYVSLRFEAVSEQPRVRRDLAIVVAEATAVATVIAAIESIDEPALQSIEVFDVFRGDGLETGFKSVALSLIFQDKASTLTDERVDTIINSVVAVLYSQCGAHIRGE